MEQRSLKILGENRTFFGKTTNTLTKLLLPTKVGFWGKLKAFFLQEITVELTPKQKKIEKEINDFLFQEIRFGKKKKA